MGAHLAQVSVQRRTRTWGTRAVWCCTRDPLRQAQGRLSENAAFRDDLVFEGTSVIRTKARAGTLAPMFFYAASFVARAPRRARSSDGEMIFMAFQS